MGKNTNCKDCGRVRKVKDIKSQKSVYCRLCGLKRSMVKRSENDEWKENLSKASKGKPKSEKHKLALRIPKKKRNKEKIKLDYSNDNINSWSINKKLALERDGNRCRHCGLVDNLEVHHMDPFKKSKNNNIDNLITLCNQCHKRAEECRLLILQKNKICGVILAGGRGTRLAPITSFHNKHELPVGAVPMIFYPIRILRSLRITDVLIVLDRGRVGRIIEMLGDGSEFGMNFTYKIQNSAGGIAEALSLAENFVKNRTMYVVLGDNIFQMNEFDRPITFWSTGCVFLKEVKNPKDYGIAEIKGDRVIEVTEKPEKPKTNLAVTGLYAYQPKVFEILKNFKPSKRGELEISDLNDFLAKSKNLSYRKIEGEWMDAGYSTEGYIEANMKALQWIKDGKK